jgi:S-adenosylmethionine decarboxylase
LPVTLETGIEWLVDAHGCAPGPLRSREALSAVFDRIVSEVGLRPAAPAVWHVFPGEGGVTGILLLTESHLTCHTFPEHGYAGFNLYCCRPRAEWPWEDRLREALSATRVSVRSFARGEGVGAPVSR